MSGLVRLWIEPQTTKQYHPLVNTVFWVGNRLWGNAMLGYHLVNIALHAVSALLLWKILRELDIPGAWLAAAIFALHPVQVDSVAWLAELKNTLSGVFFFSCILAYLKFDQTRNRGAYALALVLFCVGLLAKAIVAMAHHLARLIYRMIKNGQDYVDKGMEVYEAKYRKQRIKWLKKQAKELNLELYEMQAVA